MTLSYALPRFQGHEVISPIDALDVLCAQLRHDLFAIALVTKLVLSAKFVWQIVCLYIQPFRNYLALKLKILEKYSQIQHIWPSGKLLGKGYLSLSPPPAIG